MKRTSNTFTQLKKKKERKNNKRGDIWHNSVWLSLPSCSFPFHRDILALVFLRKKKKERKKETHDLWQYTQVDFKRWKSLETTNRWPCYVLFFSFLFVTVEFRAPKVSNFLPHKLEIVSFLSGFVVRFTREEKGGFSRFFLLQKELLPVLDFCTISSIF